MPIICHFFSISPSDFWNLDFGERRALRDFMEEQAKAMKRRG